MSKHSSAEQKLGIGRKFTGIGNKRVKQEAKKFKATPLIPPKRSNVNNQYR